MTKPNNTESTQADSTQDRGFGTMMRVTVMVGVLGLLVLLFSWFGPYQAGSGYHLKPKEVTQAGTTTLKRTLDGHYYITAKVNDMPVVFMLDTGATGVAVSKAMAEKLSLKNCTSASYSTAAGTVQGCEGRVSSFEVAGLTLRDVKVAAMPGADDKMALLGMSVLKHFKLEQQGDTLKLTP